MRFFLFVITLLNAGCASHCDDECVRGRVSEKFVKNKTTKSNLEKNGRIKSDQERSAKVRRLRNRN